ncbi:MAG: DUF29 domain-containing protein [Noviherbaspirillum sp.]
MDTPYEKDIVAWSQEQVRLLRSGQFSELDVEHIAEEIEDVGKSEQRELASRMAVLLCHLLKWKYQPAYRGASWEAAIQTQHNSIARRLRKTPSLQASFSDADWWADAWDDALAQASGETGIHYQGFPAQCPWTAAQLMSSEFFP